MVKNKPLIYLCYCILFLLNNTLSIAQTTIINPLTDGGFEAGNTFAANNWTVVNHSNNQWYVGPFAKCSGTNGAYVDANATAGSANNYAHGQARVSHFYRNVTFPAGQTTITLSFNFKGQGEGCCDFLKVFLINPATNPAAGFVLGTGQIGGTYNLQSNCTAEAITVPAAYAGTTKRLVFSWINDGSLGSDPAISIDDISLVSNIPMPPVNDNPCAATLITPATTCSYNIYSNLDATSTPVADPSCSVYSGQDVWFRIVVPASGTLIFDANSAQITDGGMAVYTGTCSALTEIACNDDASFSDLMPYLNLTGLTAGTSVWLRFWAYDADEIGTFRLCVFSPPVPANDNPCSAINIIPTTTCNYLTYSNASATATSGLSTPSCSNYNGGDVWFTTTIPASGTLIIDSKEGTLTDGSMSIYTGSCGSLSEVYCNDDGSSNALMPLVNITGIAVGTTIWIRFWNKTSSKGTFGICVYNPCLVGPPPNDACANAISVTLSVPLTGTNVCSSNINEPAKPSCWTAGAISSVWYSVKAPASGQLRVRVLPNTLKDPQVAIFSGTCGTSMTLQGCNDNSTMCGTTTNSSSDLSVSGLTPGNTYFIMVDGSQNEIGDFGLIVIDGAGPLPPLSNGQDCGTYLPVCDTVISFGNPGFQSFGNICDFPGGNPNCLLSGERGSSWFEIPVGGNGTLTFSIIPNDWPGAPSTSGTDYDFAIWKIAGAGAVTCTQISTGSAPVKCNYNNLGVTGLYGASDGNSPVAYPGFANAFNSGLAVVAGDKYVLVVSNFTNSSAGFVVEFGPLSPIAYNTSGTSSVWSGGEDNDWFKSKNWGGCPVPTCSRDAVVNGSITFQPLINSTGAVAKSIKINTGASLTLANGQHLGVCQDFVNYGSLNLSSGSVLDFTNGSVVQNIDGSLKTPNALGSIFINKTGGVVNLLQDMDMSGDMLIISSTSSFNTNGNYHKLAGVFTNYGIYTPGTGTLEFNGTAAQTYTNAATLNSVMMNHTGSGLSLLTNMVLGNTGTLTLSSGKIITGAFEVQTLNRTPSSVSTGNTTSYVEGSLRRYLNATGSYDFPLGESAKGYQGANINFAYPAAPTAIDNILGKFVIHSVTPSALGTTDCAVTYSSPGLNNGKWTFAPSSNPTSGNFDLTLYNLNYSNSAGGTYTVMSDFGSGWVMGNGTCATSTVSSVKRTGMNSLNASFATAQSPGSLPVELISFKGKALQKSVMLNWTTASESSNKGFIIQRAGSSAQFSSIGWVNGAGDSHDELNYSFEDNNVSFGQLYYYRLTQVDFDGRESESPVVTALLQDKDKNYSINLYPNPVTDESKLILRLNDDAIVEINIISMDGRKEILLENKYRLRGSHEIVINPSRLHLLPGMYMVSVKTGDKNSYLKMIFNGSE